MPQGVSFSSLLGAADGPAESVNGSRSEARWRQSSYFFLAFLATFFLAAFFATFFLAAFFLATSASS